MAKAAGPGDFSGPWLVQGIGPRMGWIGLVVCGLGLTGLFWCFAADIGGSCVPAPPNVINPRDMIALAGVGFAIFAFAYNASERLNQSRKQHTIKLLFDTRLSAEFRSHLEKRRDHFELFQDIDPETYKSYLAARRSTELSEEDAESRRKSAEALRSLLNYYEFVAFGVRTNDLDEELLKGTIRGIMCNLVQDSRLVIADQQRSSATNYEHVAWLYDRWREDRFKPIPKAQADTGGTPPA